MVVQIMYFLEDTNYANGAKTAFNSQLTNDILYD
jgi:hypothetical protein